MRTIKAKELDISSVMIDTMYVLPVIKTEDIPAKERIYLVLKDEFENAEDEDDIRLAYSKIINGQIRIEEEGKLNTYPGLLEKKKHLTVIE
jgi:hypothetical protein